jgi:Secretion system C-terminal sorting domain
MNIQINSTQTAKGSLFVTDITGKVVQMIYAGEFSFGNSTFTIQTNTWTNGIYLLVWNTDQWKISKKIIAN